MSLPTNISIAGGDITLHNLEVSFTDLVNASNTPVSGTLDFGIVREIKLRISPKNAQKDYLGRTRVPGYEVSCSFKMMQTGPVSRQRLVPYLGFSGTLRLGQLADGIALEEVIPALDADLDLSGGQSEMTITFDRDYTAAQLASIFTTSQ